MTSGAVRPQPTHDGARRAATRSPTRWATRSGHAMRAASKSLRAFDALNRPLAETTYEGVPGSSCVANGVMSPMMSARRHSLRNQAKQPLSTGRGRARRRWSALLRIRLARPRDEDQPSLLVAGRLRRAGHGTIGAPSFGRGARTGTRRRRPTIGTASLPIWRCRIWPTQPRSPSRRPTMRLVVPPT